MTMLQLSVICEGKTEALFVKEVLCSYPSLRNMIVTPMRIETSQGHYGGSLSPQRVVRYTRSVSKRRPASYITTLFDLYGLPSDFPGVKDSHSQVDPLDKARCIQQRLGTAVVADGWQYPQRFIPYIQPYEFEALLFSDVSKFKEEQSEWGVYVDKLASIRDSFQSPEHIDGGHSNHPSARLRRLLRPKYKKPLHGPSLAARIGIDRFRRECQHFDEWLSELENLQPFRAPRHEQYDHVVYRPNMD